MTGFEVIKPGVLTLIQDLGRRGYQHLGVTTGGVLDERSARWANRLLDNAPQAPLLEICLGRLVLLSRAETQVALTGADLGLELNGHPCPPWRSFRVRPGDRLEFGYAREGLRAYLAVAGGFQLTPAFGSCSTVVREGIGGLDGAPLAAGDMLPCASGLAGLPLVRLVPPCYRGETGGLPLRVLPGYQFDAFSDRARRRFFGESYRVGNDSDRMGVRLEGPALHYDGGTILSQGIALGAIQVPPDGQPIVLLNDRQTIGGYPILGALLPLDLFRLAQARPGTPVRFAPIDIDEATALMREFYDFFG